LYAGLADDRVARGDWPELLASFQAQPFEDARSVNEGLLRRAIARIAHRRVRPADQASQPAGPLEQHAALIATLCGHDDLDKMVSNLRALSSHDDPWLSRAGGNIERACPGSQRLAFSLQQRGRTLSLAEIFQLEYTATLGCVAHGDLAEGIRALLIDKDKNPRWQPKTLAEADEQWVENLLGSHGQEMKF